MTIKKYLYLFQPVLPGINVKINQTLLKMYSLITTISKEEDIAHLKESGINLIKRNIEN